MRKYIERGLEPPSYGPRQARARRLEPFEAYLRQRVVAYPGLTASRLLSQGRTPFFDAGLLCPTARSRDLAPESRLAYGRAPSRRRGLRRSREWGRFYGALQSSAA